MLQAFTDGVLPQVQYRPTSLELLVYQRGKRFPTNASATVHVPTSDASLVTESGTPASQADGVKFLRTERNAAVYRVGSGTYQFQSTLPKASSPGN